MGFKEKSDAAWHRFFNFIVANSLTVSDAYRPQANRRYSAWRRCGQLGKNRSSAGWQSGPEHEINAPYSRENDVDNGEHREAETMAGAECKNGVA